MRFSSLAPLQARQAAQVASDARQAADEREELARSLMGSVDTKVTLLQQQEASGEDLVRQAGEAVAVLQRLLQEGRNKAAVSDCSGASLP